MKKNIVIVGYGELGKAIHRLLKNNLDLVIETWDKKNQPGKLPGIITPADIILLCVPSWCITEVLTSIKKYAKKGAIFVSLSKGIDPEKLQTIDQILKNSLDKSFNFGLISGPMLAEELMSNKKGFAVFACKDKKTSNVIYKIFSGSNLKIEYSSDLRGVALCGVLKNIYSLGLGICDGLSLGGNMKGFLSLQATKEMLEIVPLLGGKKDAVFKSSGLADLIATAFSDFSRNREVGEELAKTGICCLESEGYKSINSIICLIGKKYSNFIFLNTIKEIVLDNRRPAEAFSDLFLKL